MTTPNAAPGDDTDICYPDCARRRPDGSECDDCKGFCGMCNCVCPCVCGCPSCGCDPTPENADERRCLGCDEPWQVPGTTVCQTCIVAAQDAALARQDADRG